MSINLYNIIILIEFTSINEINRYIRHSLIERTITPIVDGFSEFKKYGLTRQRKSRFTDGHHYNAYNNINKLGKPYRILIRICSL